MKKIGIAFGVLLVLATAMMFYSVWRASREPVTTTPGPLEVGRQKLHAQLEASKQREAQIEQQDWNSIPLLRELILAHQHRIDELAGNGQAGDIVAHDHEAMDRLQKRIEELQAKEAAKAEAEKEKAKEPPQQQ